MSISLQFNGDGSLVLDEDGNPVWGAAPTGDIVLAMLVTRGTFHADPDLGSDVPKITRGAPTTTDVYRDRIADGLERLEDVGALVVEEIVVNGNEATIFEAATLQPLVVSL